METIRGGIRPSFLVHLNRRFRPQYARRWKRVFDLVLAVPLFVLLLPLMALLLCAVALDGANPLFGQERVGRGGRKFRCWKIRSMVPDASERLARLLAEDPAAAAEWAEHQKLDNDPRITRLGEVLRQTSLDELPQLWNVIVGEMSLVGPRPVLEEELARYGARSEVYKSLTPGLTGPWQVTARNLVSYDERVRMDTSYARYHSLLGDLRLVLMTAVTVYQRTGR
jgi:exopolysaccharide production protein ExoY